jgi:hypothetical protein
VLLAASLVAAEPDYSASFEEFLIKFGKGYEDSAEHVSYWGQRTALSM